MKKHIKIILILTLLLQLIFGIGLIVIKLDLSGFPEYVIHSLTEDPEKTLDNSLVANNKATPSILQLTDYAVTVLPTNTPIPPTLTLTPTSTPALPYEHLYPPVNEKSYKKVPLIPQPENQINVLVLGTDQFGNRRGYRTDAIMLVTINTEDDTVNITSFPRDLYVYIPGWTVQRINTAFPYGGFKTLADTLEFNFGIRPDFYALIHVSFLEEVVYDLDGITVQVEKTLCDHRTGYSGTYCLFPGEHYMDGDTAFWYARSRHTSENDFGRNRRHQELLRGIFNRILELNALTKIPKLFDTYKENIETNMKLTAVLKLLPTAIKLGDQSRIKQYYITHDKVIDWTTPNGAQVLIPQPRLIRDVLLSALNSPIP